MSITTLTIPVPASGDGVAVDVSSLVGPKTIVLSGRFSGLYDLMVSQDGTAYVPAVQFDSGGSESVRLTVPGAFRWVRLRSGAQATTAMSCEVSAISGPGQNAFVTIANLTSGFGGYGPIVDTSIAVPPSGSEVDTCFLCRGGFVGQMVVLGSADGVDFTPVGQYTVEQLPPGATVLEFSPLLIEAKLRYFRVLVNGTVVGGLTVTMGGRVPTSVASQGVASVDNIADLRLWPVLSDQVLVAGYYAPADGGGGPFAWDSASVAADNGGTIILPTGHVGPGRWVRTFDGPTEVAYFGALGSGDDTAKIQAAINSVTAGTVSFTARTYLLSAALVLKSNVSLLGNGAMLTYLQSWGSDANFVSGTGVSNVTVDGVTFDGLGSWTAIPFPNPYGGGNSVGFTNNHNGMWLTTCSSIRVRNCQFKGLGHGIRLSTNSTNIKVLGCELSNLGAAGIDVHDTSHLIIDHTSIQGVYGNMTTAGDTNVANSKYADGCYFFSVQHATIGGCVIEDIVRIGVVLESSGTPRTSGVSITGNTFSNFHDSRGGEGNAAVWSDNHQCDLSCVVSGNTMNNTGAVVGGGAVGVTACQLTVVGNSITGFYSQGITAVQSRIYNNLINNNGKGVVVVFQLAGETTNISGNEISYNNGSGIEIYQCHGMLDVSGNLIADNGVAPLTHAACSGVIVNPYYNDQKVRITSNRFLSSADQGDSDGQLYGILGVAGGDFDRTMDLIFNNSFLFTGTFASVRPNDWGINPCSFGYWDTTNFFGYEINGTNGNTNSKFPTQPQDSYPGVPLYVGYANSIPIAGTWCKGDLFLNGNQAIGQPYGWICTAAGTPGTWNVISVLT